MNNANCHTECVSDVDLRELIRAYETHPAALFQPQVLTCLKELQSIRELQVHLSSCGKKDTPMYTRADVQALIAVSLAAAKRHRTDDLVTEDKR
jgi:hypothetical protein